MIDCLIEKVLSKQENVAPFLSVLLVLMLYWKSKADYWKSKLIVAFHGTVGVPVGSRRGTLNLRESIIPFNR